MDKNEIKTYYESQIEQLKTSPVIDVKNEIKKILYKEKPIARKIGYQLTHQGGFYYYVAITSIGLVNFEIPEKDKPDNLEKEEPAQLLIRWLKK